MLYSDMLTLFTPIGGLFKGTVRYFYALITQRTFGLSTLAFVLARGHACYCTTVK